MDLKYSKGLLTLEKNGQAILAEMAQFIIFWNHLESVCRDILQVLAGGTTTAFILTKNMSSRALLDCMCKACEKQNSLQEALFHIALCMEDLTDHRNVIAHDSIGLVKNRHGKNALNCVEVKVFRKTTKKPYLKNEKYAISELEKLSQNCFDVITFSQYVHAQITTKQSNDTLLKNLTHVIKPERLPPL